MIFIPISLALLALTAGMFLLAKTRKEDLGKSFKAISYFVIISSFLIMCLTLIGGFTKMMMRRMHHMENHECMMHSQNRMPWMRERFMHHERMGMGRMNRWNETNRMEGDDRMDTTETHQHDRFNGRSEMEIKRLSEKLNLTNEQIGKVQEIFKNSIQQEMAQRTQSDGNREQFGKSMREAHQSRMEAVKKILTPEQLKLFSESENHIWHNRHQ